MGELKIRVKDFIKENDASDKPKEPVFIGGYELVEPLSTKNSGFSKWGFCKSGDETLFIKEFLTPVFPENAEQIAPEIRNKRCKECEAWYEKKNRLYGKICEAQNGNLIVPQRFFKDKSHFYIITELVPKCDITFEKCNSLTFEKKILLLKVIASSFSMLASKGIVHADMKPDNLLFKETIKGYYTVKIIDFDASYHVSEPPFGDDVQGTPEYFAPESFLALIEQPVQLTPKVDVFALGIIFHELLCGEKPKFDSEYSYIYEAVLNDSPLELHQSISPEYQEIIKNMLCKNQEDRWSAGMIFNRLKQCEKAVKAVNY